MAIRSASANLGGGTRETRKQPTGNGAVSRRASDDDADGSADAEIGSLRSEVARVRSVLNSAVDLAVVTLDPGGLITGWNSGAVSIFGCDCR